MSSSVTYIKGDLFSAPKGSILVHACNTVGSWGGGIALAFRDKYPQQFLEYKEHCASHTKAELIGTCLLLEDPLSGHGIACLFTSKMYGKRKDKPEAILSATHQAVSDLLAQNTNQRPLHACRFNSGKFAVPWAQTEDILNALGAEMIVYDPEAPTSTPS
ncbi:hypothetical protein DL96DRAFT_1717522 [Flagelloscypha sp. PMI_526]|nr:hypothetical protein DL96DRAFT_1717522 [Flagelloscypha sp. PMI_526]